MLGKLRVLVVDDEPEISAMIAEFFRDRGHETATAQNMAEALDELRAGRLIPTRNLAAPDPACGDIDLVTAPRSGAYRTAMKNSFALGGFNASLIVRKHHD